MSVLKIGSKGPQVTSLQLNLKTVGFFKFEADGDFGPDTLMCVKQFQKSIGIKADGIVGEQTMAKLRENVDLIKKKSISSSRPVIATSVEQKPLALRCLELTATIETSQAPPHCFAMVSGNFDKMAVSFGALQWNFGQKSLQPILNNIINNYPQVAASVFQNNLQTLKKLLAGRFEELMSYFSNIQVQDKNAWLQWQEQFKKLGYTKECVEAQLKEASAKYQAALAMCEDYGLYTENAVALMFDIIVQNGSIKSSTRASILQDFSSAKNETEKLVIIANRRAADAKAEWQKDVLARKETIARGFGKVHGKNFDLKSDFGISNVEAKDLKSYKLSAA